MLMLLQPLYLAWFVAGATQHDLGEVVLAAVAFSASLGLGMALSLSGIHARLLQMERVGLAFDVRIAEITSSIPTLDHLESPGYLDELQAFRDQEGALGGALNELLNTLRNVIFVAGTLTLAAIADWRLLLVAAAGVPLVVATRWTIAWTAAAEKVAAPRGRLTAHLVRLSLTPTSGAEMRVFGLTGAVRSRLREAVVSWRAPMVDLARRQGLVDVAGNVVFFGVAGAVLAWMVNDAIAGTVSLPRLTLAVMLIGRLQATSNNLMWSLRNLSRLVRTAGRFVWLLDYNEAVSRAHPGHALPPVALQDGIRLEKVGYSYPDAATPALSDVSLDIPAGTVVALVGENGSGKSTLVKLLTGMYRPTCGRVLVDGVDLAQMDLAAWRERSAGVFQDYARLELSVLETVGAGDVAYVHDPVRVGQALRDAASEEIVATLPNGLDSQLGPTWPGGVDLSGGQWQRLAIARGAMRRIPLLLVLDEPTAALDATTEHALFESYAAAAHAAGRRGAITLLVTHRFSTVSAADLVVVMDKGRIVETGGHGQLMRAKGHYAELYELQARGYR